MTKDSDFEAVMATYEMDYMGYCGLKKRPVRWTLDCTNCVKRSAINPDMNFNAIIALEREYFDKDIVEKSNAIESMSEEEHEKIFTRLLPGCMYTRFKREEVEINGRKVMKATDEVEEVPAVLYKTTIWAGKRTSSTGRSFHCRLCNAELSPEIYARHCDWKRTICPECGAIVRRAKVRRNIIRRLLKFLGLRK